MIVAGLRLFGFDVYRNTYKPLLAETLIDFWGRYYYYFKELLVEFFFYPTYLEYRELHPRLRVTLAVFAAAFAGNLYYHVLAARYPLLEGRLPDILELLKPRVVYCFLLAAGISMSMIRQRERRGRATEAAGAAVQLRRLRAIFGVWTFFAIIQVWNAPAPSLSILDRLDFVLFLMGR